MTSWIPPLTEDSPVAWDLMAAEASRHWSKEHPVRSRIAALEARRRRKQGHAADVPPVAELVERSSFQALRGRRQWLLHLARLKAAGKDDFRDSHLDDLLGD